ncbi:hypothetical protein PPO43_10010 [Saprospira sp. CCB-QB6]|uniref:hypothetical protein n=1 Tax=Saprospira sp. CCB-QB6 TaxID=3023936 RepID=UPI00234B58B3|nr:hypothetical protein [Saprospira sp. CCB-QB6]WCL80312.1 hypothetical protein PPO43_10010 [Saprospira sp. CCB-QB6]
MRFLFAFFLLSTSLLLSCDKNGDRLELPFTTWVEVPAGLNGVLTYHFPADIYTNGTVPENLKQAQPARIRLYLEDGEASFDFARRVYLDAVTDSSRNELGYRLDVPLDNSASLDLFPSIVDLKDQLAQEQFRIEVKIDLRSTTTATSRMRIELDFLAELLD